MSDFPPAARPARPSRPVLTLGARRLLAVAVAGVFVVTSVGVLAARRASAQVASLAVEAQVVPARVRPGGALTYTVSYANGSGETRTGAHLVVAMGDGQAFHGAWTAEPALPPASLVEDPEGRSLDWTLGDLPPGAQGVVHYVLTADREREPAADLPILTVDSVMSLTATSPTAPVSTTTSATVVGPLLRVVKTASATSALPGRPITYTLTLSSLGPGAGRPDATTATGIVVSETLPARAKLYALGEGADLIPAIPAVAWSLPDPLPPDAVRTYSFTVRSDPSLAAGSVVENPAHTYRAWSDEMTASSAWGRTSPRTTMTPNLEATAVTSQDGGLAFPGDPVTYTVDIRNPDPERLTNVAVTVTLPAPAEGQLLQPLSFAHSLPGTPAPDKVLGDRVGWHHVTLPPWGAARLEFVALVAGTVYAPAEGQTYALARLEALKPGSFFRAIANRADITVEPALSLRAAAEPATVALDAPVRYDVTLENRSAHDVAGIALHHALRPTVNEWPDHFTFAVQFDGPPPVHAGAFPIDWTNIAVPAHGLLRLYYAALVDGQAGETYASDFTVTSPDADISPALGVAGVTIGSPFAIAKTVSPTDVLRGEQVLYTLTITNTSSAVFQVRQVQDTIPTGLTYGDGDTYIHTFSPAMNMVPGASWSGTFNAQASDELPCASLPLVSPNRAGNIRLMLAGQTGPPHLSAHDLAPLVIHPDVSIGVTSTRTLVGQGEELEYGVGLTNRAVHDVSRLDPLLLLPPGFTYVGMAAGPAPIVEEGDMGARVHWPAAELAAGQHVVYRVLVRSGAYGGTVTVAAGQASAQEACVGSVEDAAPVDVLPAGQQALELATVVEGDAQVPPRSRAVFAISLTNRADTVLMADVVTGTMPAGFDYVRMIFAPGGPGEPAVRGGDLLWGHVAVPPHGTRSWRYQVQAPEAPGTGANTVRAHAGRQTYGPATAAVSVVPAVGLAKRASSATVATGDVFSYVLSVTNDSLYPVAHIAITDTLPEGIVFVRPSPGSAAPLAVAADGSQVIWADVSLAPRATYEIAYEAWVSPATRAGIQYSQVAGWSTEGVLAPIPRAAPVDVTVRALTPTATPSATPTRTPRPSATATGTRSPTPLPTTPGPSPTPTRTPRPTATGSPPRGIYLPVCTKGAMP